ncbi:Tetratricopeptide TPR_4 [Trichormus variabilis ATCC 29413]|uniref:Tetratricopeptide TPR_4 n=3 Tax=Nostocales TaxID=1161 RepID=Q3M5F4_TRIV2|nr:Tetratricopeptide TPR_4 [Trichormus variabilis ATCC 29413]
MVRFKEFLWKQRQKFRYGILAFVMALLCIFVSPVVARDRGSPGLTASVVASDFSRDLENPSPNLSRQLLQVGKAAQRTGSPARREALKFPPSLVGKGVRGLGFALAFPHNVKSQVVASVPQEEEAKNLYTAGRFAEAVQLLQQVLPAYQTSGDTVAQAVILSNLALNLHQLGRIGEATEAIEKAIAILQTSPNSPQRLSIWAQVWDVKGSLELAQGKAEAALSAWEKSALLYQQLKDHNKATLAQVNQAQALQTLGLYRREITLLQNLTTSLAKQPDSLSKAASFRNLGEALILAGDLKQAEVNLQTSLKIAQQLQSPEAIASAYLSLGNLAYLPGNSTQQKNIALNYYQQASVLSTTATTKISSQLNRLRLLIDLEQWSNAQALYSEIQSQIANLPLGRSAIYAQVNLAQSLLKLTKKFPNPSPETIGKILAVARQQAEQLQDVRAGSFVLGNLGHLYELSHQWSIAQDLTRKALNLSQSIHAPDIDYRWQWQLGRVLCQGKRQCEQQGDMQGAIAAYTEAFNTLQNIRTDLIATNKNVQFSFRETVEPVYRRLVDLLLQSSAPSQDNLIQARNVIEALQVAKLQNYLQQTCQDTRLELDQVIDSKDQTSAIIYAIILDDRVEVILKRPNQKLDHYATKPQEKIEEVVKRLYQNLQEVGSYEEVQQDGQQVYSWLIQPIEKKLKESKIKNLVFVLDGFLRKIPMASLYDGQQYLVEKYAVSLALGLQVREPKPLNRSKMQVLAASLTEPPNKPGFSGFSRLANVNQEVREIKNTGIAVHWITDKEFTTKNFNQKLNTSNFDVIHLATHGLFSADRENTFVVTADGKLKIDDFDQLFIDQQQNSTHKIELLILSACQTATGNDQAVMGIAGATVQAGASSAIASLWDLDDEASVPFIKEFYQHLGQPNISRAEALRLAQQALLKNPKYDHPRYWAPYVLIGSWL